MENVESTKNGLIELNQGILNHIRCVSSENTRFTAATKLGISIPTVEEICELDAFQLRQKAVDFAEKGMIITLNNLVTEKKINERSLSVDSFYKASMH